MNQSLDFQPKKYLLIVLIAFILSLLISNAYDAWKRRNGWCMKFDYDGSSQTFYGSDCEIEEPENLSSTFLFNTPILQQYFKHSFGV